MSTSTAHSKRTNSQCRTCPIRGRPRSRLVAQVNLRRLWSPKLPTKASMKTFSLWIIQRALSLWEPVPITPWVRKIGSVEQALLQAFNRDKRQLIWTVLMRQSKPNLVSYRRTWKRWPKRRLPRISSCSNKFPRLQKKIWWHRWISESCHFSWAKTSLF